MHKLLMAGLKQTFYNTQTSIGQTVATQFFITYFDTWIATQIMTFYPGVGFIPTDYEVDRHQTDSITYTIITQDAYSTFQTWRFTTW